MKPNSSLSSSHMQIPDTESYAALIVEAVWQHAAQPVEVVFDDDVPSWCAERYGHYCGNPVAMATRDGLTGRVHGLAVDKVLGENCMRIVRRDYSCYIDATPLRRNRLNSYEAAIPHE